MVGDEDPFAPFGLFFGGGGGGGGGGVGEDGDTAGAGAGGEVRRVGVDGVEEWDNGFVYRAFWRFVWR